MSLNTEIDYKQTKKNARSVLKSCRSLQRRSGMTVSLQSPAITDMPRNSNSRNNEEHKIIKSLERINKQYYEMAKRDKEQLQAINAALDLLPDVSKEILFYSYCVSNPCNTVKLSRLITVSREDEFGNLQQISYSPKSIERLKSNALIEFAEAFKEGELLHYKA